MRGLVVRERDSLLPACFFSSSSSFQAQQTRVISRACRRTPLYPLPRLLLRPCGGAIDLARAAGTGTGRSLGSRSPCLSSPRQPATPRIERMRFLSRGSSDYNPGLGGVLLLDCRPAPSIDHLLIAGRDGYRRCVRYCDVPRRHRLPFAHKHRAARRMERSIGP